MVYRQSPIAVLTGPGVE